ncbi:hypothetical protein GGF46_005460 [Coemansia sp. RSA 552]|nr:hypothetical protein GGF46_005460 [Coemansia sp. RSA 552]
MSIASTHSQLQRQLYLLGYAQPLPEDGVQLVSMLLKDMQASLDRVKELETSATKLEREERTSRAGCDKMRGELQQLRTENNQMRTEVLNHTRELDRMRREARTDGYQASKEADDLRMENLRVRAEAAECRRRFDECQKRLEAQVTNRDPAGRIPNITSSRALLPAAAKGVPRGSSEAQPAIVDLVDLSSRRINALEEEIEVLEGKLRTTTSELSATQLEVKERDIEILRLNSSSDTGKTAGGSQRTSGIYGSDPVARLTDQVDYLHERAEQLERESEEQRSQFLKEKEELHRRWVQTENERVRLAEMHAAPSNNSGGDGQQASGSTVSAKADPEIDRLRTECANIKSLYAQTRDQLQELLRSGNAETRRLQADLEAAGKVEKEQRAQAAGLQNKVGDLEGQVARLQGRADEAQGLQERVDGLEKQTQEGDAARWKLAERTKELEETRAEYQELVGRHSKLDRSLAQAVSEVSEWRAKAESREHRLADATRRLDEARLGHKQAAAELRTSQRTLETYTRDLATLRDTQQNAQRENDAMREELDQLTRLRRAVEMAKDDYKRQLARALAENDGHRQLVAHLQAERRALRVQVNAQFHLSQRLEQRLEAADPAGYIREPLPGLSGSADDLPTLRQPSRSSSAAHSSRSFGGGLSVAGHDDSSSTSA